MNPLSFIGYSHSVDATLKRGQYFLPQVARIIFGIRSNLAPKREEMKKIAALTLSLFLITGTALADTPKDADPPRSKAARPGLPDEPPAKIDAAVDCGLGYRCEVLAAVRVSIED